MRERIIASTALLCLVSVPSIGQCVTSNPNVSITSAGSMGLSSSDSSLSAAITSAAGIWNNCGSAGIPSVMANGSGSVNATIVHHSGQSTRSDGACGGGAPTLDSSGHVTGGTIDIWDSWGSGANTPAGTDCTLYSTGEA